MVLCKIGITSKSWSPGKKAARGVWYLLRVSQRKAGICPGALGSQAAPLQPAWPPQLPDCLFPASRLLTESLAETSFGHGLGFYLAPWHSWIWSALRLSRVLPRISSPPCWLGWWMQLPLIPLGLEEAQPVAGQWSCLARVRLLLCPGCLCPGQRIVDAWL